LGPIPVNDVVVDMSRQTQGVLSHAVPAGNIGSGLLRRFTITLDYRNQRIYFAPNARTITPDAYDRAGLWINRDGHAFRVVAVVDGSPAAAAGVAAGDRIVAVDGVRAASVELGELRDRWAEMPAGTYVKLTLQRENAERIVAFRLRDLI
jgi:C-terminal processing protease CtpA/Prc